MSFSTTDIAYRLSPYCGAPPTMRTLWSRWNFDPVLITCLLVGAAVFFILDARSARVHDRRRHGWMLFVAGWAITSLLLISPLCALSVALFSARVTQHMLLVMVGAPLVAASLPRLRLISPGGELAAAGVFATTLWFWHAPAPYATTFQGAVTYWLMHLSTYGAAVWFWLVVLRAPRQRLAWSVAASMITSWQMALLAAIITFAGRPLYAPHALTTVAWGLTPLGDQQLGGAIMWAPAGALFVAAILLPLSRVLAEPSRHRLAILKP